MIPAAALIEEFRSQGINLTLQDDSLRIEAGGGSLTPNIVARIRENKSVLVQFLKRTCGSVRRLEGVLIQTPEELFQIETYVHENDIRKVFVDTETIGLDPLSHHNMLVLIQIMAGDRLFLVDIPRILASTANDISFCFDGIQQIIESPDILKVGQNLKFDIKFLKKLYHDLKPRNLFDTYLAECVLTAGRDSDRSLEGVILKYFNRRMDKSAQTTFTTAPFTKDQIAYAMADVMVLEPLFRKQVQALADAELTQVALLEFAIIPLVADIELAGMKIDPEKIETLKKQSLDRLKGLEAELLEMVRGINLDGQLSMAPSVNFASPVQVKKVLACMGIDVENTSVEVLEKIRHPFAEKLLQYRAVSKSVSTFLDKLPRHIHPATGRIHPEFLQMGTQTGRFSCQKPNLQQIPHEQEWRDLFIAEPGKMIITADYSQIELRILAEYSQDPAFLEAYRTGQDLHRRTAADVYGVPIDTVTKEQRSATKAVNFGLCYGMGAGGLAARLKITEQEAQQFITRYFRAYPKVKDCLQRLGMIAVTDLCSKTLLGRKRHFKKPDSMSAQKSLERKGRNSPIQSTCGDIVKKALSLLQDSLADNGAKIINLVHDEIVLEVEADRAEEVAGIVTRDMIQAGEFFLKSVPVQVDHHIDHVWRK